MTQGKAKGSTKIKENENDKADNVNGIVKEIEEMLLSYDIKFKSDTSGNIPTHYNYNGGWSQVDFLATSSNFHKITNVRYIQFHESGDHVGLETTMRFPN